MVKFAHIADVHLGGWKQQPLQELNFKSFQEAIGICISRKVDFVLLAGDLFDSPYPPIDVLKETFSEFRKLKDAGIPCFMIAGSHDYSASGKTFLDVLEKTGFCKNVVDFEETENEIFLKPTIHNNVSIYGFPGKKTGLEVQDIKKIKLQPTSEENLKILMLHTTLDRVVGNLPIESVDSSKLPRTDYCALGHIHVLYNRDEFVYPGPLFPNNFKELEDLSHGHFVISDTSNPRDIERISLPLKEVEKININLTNGFTATDEIISDIKKRNVENKIILLRVSGELEKGKNSDLDFQKVEKFARENGAYFLLKNIHNLKTREDDLDFEVKSMENVEEESLRIYSEQNPSEFNNLVYLIINTLSMEKQEGETSDSFTRRLTDEARKILNF
ncbi:hypothetical protein COU59_00280 [Candidatus Pacearchaeota archaeon CG10_big_fil_rev_8_21_14_0_10_34_12]|nr:MAG: hypothetical protein COU59_00280 [Candidatus Pacearchaeota archaeon CG10_big_fil_rev_8_21_14_0_10_34_12]